MIGNATGVDVDKEGINFSLFDGFMDWLLWVAAGISLILFLVLCTCISKDRDSRIQIETVGLNSEGESSIHRLARKSGETKFLVPVLFFANFVGIVIFMILDEDMAPVQAILCWFFLSQSLLFGGITTALNVQKKSDMDILVVVSFLLGSWS